MTVERINSLDPKGLGDLAINFIAMNKKGEFGAAGTNKGFKYAFASQTESGVKEAMALPMVKKAMTLPEVDSSLMLVEDNSPCCFVQLPAHALERRSTSL